MATKPDPSETTNPKKRLARQEAEAGEGYAAAPPAAPAPKPAVSQSEFSGYGGKKKGGPPAEMLKKHEADEEQREKARLKKAGMY